MGISRAPPKIAAEVLARVNGRQRLILGDNDPPELIRLGWASVAANAVLIVGG